MNPVLSIVATSRNDDHGGDLNDRMQWFVDGLLWHATRRKVVLELLLVEWNPPEDRPPLVEILRWPAETDWLKVRILPCRLPFTGTWYRVPRCRCCK